MVDWNPALPVPAQLADAFAALYDWFELHCFEDADNQLWDQSVGDDPVIPLLVRSVSASAEHTPGELQSQIDRVRVSGDEHQLAYVVYRCLYAIDWGLARQHPLHAARTVNEPAAKVLERYDRVARYNTDETDGYVLPKWTSRYRGTAFAEHFVNLVRARVDRDRIRVLGRNARSHRLRSRENPSVAIVPFLYSLRGEEPAFADARFAEVAVGSKPCFEVRHKVDKRSNLDERVRQAVVAVRQSGATIAVFPELVLSERLLNVLREQLGATDSPETKVEWVIAGTALPTSAPSRWPIANEAHVLTSAGNLVAFPCPDGSQLSWIQAKRHRYKLTKREQERYGIKDCFKDDHDRLEAITIGKHHVVFEDRSGRYAVLICEDLGQEERTLDQLRKMLCRLIVVILMDGPVTEGRWAAEKAGNVVAQTGSFVVVANSLLLPNLPKVRQYLQDSHGIADPYPAGEQPVGLLIQPQEEDQPPPRVEFFYARATPDSGDDLSVISGVKPIPMTPHLPYAR